MAINTIKATIQMRRGNETDFNPDQMTAGEWAVSTDSKKVWMCFAPGIVRRMATYEAFEEDMLIIQQILATCQDIQVAVEAFERLAEKHKNDAANSAKAAAGSAAAAKASETKSKASEESAAGSASDSAASATAAAGSATSAAGSATTATKKATAAGNSASAAATSAADAASSANTATDKANAASTSATASAASATSADTYAKQAQSYAVGTGGVRPNEAIDSAKYYYEQSKGISEGLSGVFQPKGSVTFAKLPPLANVGSGWTYNILDKFTTTSDFNEGAGHVIPAGANVYKTVDGKWDILAGTPVATVNGQTGNVEVNLGNITGTLPVNKGGTGATTAADGFNNLAINANNAANEYVPVDGDSTLILNTESSPTPKGYKMKFLALWKYIKSKLSPVATSGSYADLSNKPTIPAAVAVKGNAETSYRTGNVNLTPDNIGAFPGSIRLTNENLNDVKDPGVYYTTGGHSVTSTPNNEKLAFSLVVLKNASSYYIQRLTYVSENSPSRLYERIFNGSNWASWYLRPLGIKGNAETEYRGGDVNLTPENIGALSLKGGILTGNLRMEGNDRGIRFDNADASRQFWIGVSGAGDRFVLYNNIAKQTVAGYNPTTNRLDIESNTDLVVKRHALFKRPTAVGTFNGGTDNACWVILALITINERYVNGTIELEVGGRDQKLSTLLTIQFKNVDGVDPDLGSFFYSGANTGDLFRIKKVSTSNWELVVNKRIYHGYIIMRAHAYNDSGDKTGITVQFPNTHLGVSPDSTWIAPTLGGLTGTAKQLQNFVAPTAGTDGNIGTDYDTSAIGYVTNSDLIPSIFGTGVNSCVLYQCKADGSAKHQIFGRIATGELAVRAKGHDGVFTSIRKILDNKNYASYISEATTSKAGLLSTTDKAKVDIINKAIIDANYKTKFRTETKGDTKLGAYITAIRNNTASVDSSPQHGSGLAFGQENTHGYLYVDYATKNAYIGGGNQDRLVWVDKIALAHLATQSTSGLMSAADKTKLDGLSSGGSTNAWTLIKHEGSPNNQPRYVTIPSNYVELLIVIGLASTTGWPLKPKTYVIPNIVGAWIQDTIDDKVFHISKENATSAYVSVYSGSSYSIYGR